MWEENREKIRNNQIGEYYITQVKALLYSMPVNELLSSDFIRISSLDKVFFMPFFIGSVLK